MNKTLSTYPKLFDCFLFFNELDLLEKRLELLYDIVDYFVICESSKTFSGLDKPLYFNKNKDRYERFKDKILYYCIPANKQDIKIEIINEYFTNENKSFSHKHNGRKVITLSPSVKLEIYQRDCLVVPLIGTAIQGDIVLLSDLDELPNPESLSYIINNFNPSIIYHFRQTWYTYWINNQVDSEWFGTRAFEFSKLKNASMDYHRFPTEIRSQQLGVIIENGGWHFSYLGGEEAIKIKLKSLAFQGFRAYVTNIMMNLFPKYLSLILNKDRDILRKGRRFFKVGIDNKFPSCILNDKNFIEKYSSK
jgi:beta-1,4-mannosyl-glycoprotein beta-1,4-N-acetylglucosaminyltransferase